MAWVHRLWVRLQSLFRRERFARELDREIQFHLDELTAENIATGMSKEQAGYAVLHAMRIQENGRSWDQGLICTTKKLGRLWFRYSVEEIFRKSPGCELCVNTCSPIHVI